MSVTDVDNPARLIRLAVAAQQHSVVLCDFDETLWLRNSTESYLDSVRPRWLAVLLLQMLDVVRPWGLLPGPNRRFLYRDWMRVLLVTVFIPWTLPRWRRSAAVLGGQWRNQELLDSVGGVAPLHVVTFGFGPVVRPLLTALHPSARLTVASGLLRGWQVRAKGKRAAVESELSRGIVAEALFITDSADDADLLAACRTPMLLVWPSAQYVPAHCTSYVPFLYTRRGKRAGQKYLLHNVLLEDVAVLGLAFAWTADRPVLVAAGLALLHASFWIIYEIGYHENDHYAVRREQKPHRPVGSAEYAKRMKPHLAWMCSLVPALPGCWLLAAGAGSSLRVGGGFDELLPRAGAVLLAWTGYLVASRGAYWIYNRLPEDRRSPMYIVLQLTRTAGYGVLLVLDPTGVVVVGALVLGRWIPYLAYRDLGVHLRISHRMLMLIAFCLLGAVQSVSEPSTWWDMQAAVAFLYFLARARRPVQALFDPTRGRTSDAGSGAL